MFNVHRSMRRAVSSSSGEMEEGGRGGDGCARLLVVFAYSRDLGPQQDKTRYEATIRDTKAYKARREMRARLDAVYKVPYHTVISHY